MKFVVHKNYAGELWFVIRAKNGQTMVTSETYRRRAGVMKAIGALQRAGLALPVEDAIDPLVSPRRRA